MAKFTLFILSAIFFVHVAAEDCICEEYTDEEKREIWNFLSKVSEEMSNEDGIIPGLLSPIVPCGNCLEGARKKRTVLTNITEKPEAENVDADSDEDIALPNADTRCPVGYARIAYMCVSMADLYKKK